MEKNSLLKWVVAFTMTCSCFMSLAQSPGNYLLVGQVTDEAGEPLPGANVYMRGDIGNGTSTDANGYYSLELPGGKDIIVEASFLGMKTTSIEYIGQAELNFVLRADDNMMMEAVVTGRQNINDVDIRAKAGVINVVDVKRMQDKPMIDMSLSLQGAAPGLVVTNRGDLGTKPEIRIRGNTSFREGDTANEPLYVLDGQVISSDAFMTLNPMDIADIKILKDAVACALYGTKAANGVIEITSVRGTNGETLVTYNFNGGVTMRGRRAVPMMDSAEKLELERLLKNPEAPGYLYSEDYYRRYYPNNPNLDQMIAEGQAVLDKLRQTNTDWFKTLLRNDFYQRHNLSVRGGNSKTSYYASANYSYQGGQIPGNDVSRFTGRISLDQAVGKRGYVSLSVNGGYSKADSPNGSSYSPSSLVYELNPYESPESGELWSYPNRTYDDLVYQYDRTSTEKRFGTTASINLEPLDGLQVDAVAGIDLVLSESLELIPSTAYEEINSGAAENERGRLTKAKNTNTNITTNVRVTYNKIIGKHDFTVGANTDYYWDDIDNMSLTGYGVGTQKSAAAINQSLEGSRKVSISNLHEKTAQVGIGVLGGYTFDETYDVFGTYKADASSILPKDKRWNAAWAVGAGWNVKSYFKDWNPVSALRFKASYGRTANLAGVSPALAMATFSYLDDSYGDTRLLELMSLYNDSLKPEQTVSTEAGVSFGLFNVVSFDVGWYNRVTEDALLDVPIPSSNGFTTLKRNIGVLSNSGIEASVSARILDMNDLRLNLRFSIAYNENKVIDLYDGDRLYTSEDAIIPDFEVGKAYDMLYGPISLGLDPMTGLPVFQGADGREIQADETLTRDDMVALGHSVPPYSGTINLSFTWKNLEFDADFYYVFGGVKQYAYSYVRYYDDANKNAVKGQVDNMWFKPGDQNKMYHTPFYSSSVIENLTAWPNSKSIGSSDYLRLSMLSLRYRLSEKQLEWTKGVVKYANVALQASNLFTVTRYRESDPESGSLVGQQQPVVTLSLSLSF
ncbi:MAG TPA: SusC/RagA family TonB-linked outer membrane protein [Candidatus Cryptobacteroides intestinipullorum]|nr:SusC/RagA family TonB-linked outer membrane protein [Candidatus Cryptobacteroides intestinipullorum]